MPPVSVKICIVLFYASAPVLLAVRFKWPTLMRWWTLVLLAALLGWAFTNLAGYFGHAHTTDLIRQAGGFDRAPRELIEELRNYEGRRFNALLIAWLLGLVVLVPWLALYGLAHQLRIRRDAKRRLLPNKSCMDSSGK
jgi:hypothetical protein